MAEDRIDILIQAVNKASAEIQRVQKDLIGLGVTAKTTQSGMAAFSTSMKNVSTQLRGVGIGLSAAITLPLTLLGIAAIKTAAEFEQSITNAFSVMQGASEEARGELEAFARQLGRDTAFTASQAADAMYKLASAGLETQDIMDSLEPILDLAAATQTELAEAAELTTTTLKVFGLEASKAQVITDSFAAGIANTNLNFERIREAMKFAAPAMAAFGKTVEETTAALGLFADAGLFGTRAGTGLRRILSRLADPTSEMTNVFTGLGIAMKDLNPEVHSLGEIFDTLQESGISATQVFKAFGQIAATPVLAALKVAEGQGKKVSEVLNELEGNMGATGLAAKIAAQQLDTISGEFLKLKSSIDEVFLSFKEDVIGDSLKEFIADIRNFVNSIGEIEAGTKKTIVLIGGFLAVLGPTALLVSVLTGALAALATTMGLIIGSIVAVTVALIALRDSALFPVIVTIATFVATFLTIQKIVAVATAVKVALVSIGIAATAAGTSASAAAIGFTALKVAIASLNPYVLAATVVLTTIGWLYIDATRKASNLRSANEELAESFELLKVAGPKAGELAIGLEEAIEKTKQATKELNELYETGAKREDIKLGWVIRAGTFDDLRAELLDAWIAMGKTDEELKVLTNGLELFGAEVDSTTEDINKFGSNSALAAEDIEKIASSTEGFAKVLAKLPDLFEFDLQEKIKQGIPLEKAMSDILDGAREILKELPGDVEVMFDSVEKDFLQRIAKQEGIGIAYVWALGEGMTSSEAKKALESAGIEVSDTTLGAILAKSDEFTKAGDKEGVLLMLGFEDAGEREAILGAENVIAATIDALEAKEGEVFGEGTLIGAGTGWAIVRGLDSVTPALVNIATKIAKVLTAIANGAIKANSTVGRIGALAGRTLGLAADSMGDLTSELLSGAASIEDAIEDVGGGAGGAAEKISDLDKALEDLIKRQNTFVDEALEVATVLQHEFEGIEEPIENIIEDYDDVEEALDNIIDTVATLREEHQKFIDEAEKGIKAHAGIIEDINEAYSELNDQVIESAAINLAKDFATALEAEEKLTTDLIKANERLDEARGSGDQRAIKAAQERVDLLEKEKEKAREFQKEFEQLTAEGANFTVELEDADKVLEELKQKEQELLEAGKDTSDIKEQITDAEQISSVLLGKQKIIEDGMLALQEQEARNQAELELSALDFEAYLLGEKLKNLDEEQVKAIKNELDLQRIRKAIVEDRIGELDLETLGEGELSAEALKLLAEAQEAEKIFTEGLTTQFELLDKLKKDEVSIAEETTAKLIENQGILENDLVSSYDRLIAKLGEVAIAAEKASMASASVVSGADVTLTEALPEGFDGGFFARGGYTGGGNIKDVAGIVHKGEWVAPNWMVKSFRPMFSFLEGMRKRKVKGYSEGGMVGEGGTTFNTPVTMNNNISTEMDFNAIARNFKWIIQTS